MAPVRVLAVTAYPDLPEAQALIGLSRRGVHVEVLCHETARFRSLLIDAGVPAYSLALSGRIDLAGTAAIRRHLVDGRFNIVHAFNSKAVANALRASKGLDVRFVAYRGIVGNVDVWSPASWMTYLNPRVDRIVCVADAIRRHLAGKRLFGWRMPADKAVTIYKGHDLDWYTAPPVTRASLGIPDDAFVVGCTANERPHKGLRYLVEAAGLLPRDANVHVLLIGSKQRWRTRRAIAASPASDRIHIAGYRDDAPQVLANCDVSVLPALRREGLSKSIIEGMVYGVTPIATNVGGNPELIIPGENGLIIEPGSAEAIANAILALQENPWHRKAMGVSAREHIQQNFHSSTTVEQTLALYNDLLGLPVEPFVERDNEAQEDLREVVGAG